MVRTRSRSPHREVRRDKDRSGRHGDRHKHRAERPRRRSRSKSPHSGKSKRSSPSRKRSRRSSRTPDHEHRPVHDGDVIVIDDQKPELNADLEGKTEEEVDMMRLMGFSGFDSTKGKKVQGNDVSATNIVHKRKYRQYMNRRGGFNRPLDYVA